MSEEDSVYGKNIKKAPVNEKKQGSIFDRLVDELEDNIRYDDTANEERRSAEFDADKKRIELKTAQAMLRDITINQWFRGGMIVVITVCEIVYVCNVLCIIKNNAESYHLTDAVLIALLTTTTANMLALLAFIIKYLFPQRK